MIWPEWLPHTASLLIYSLDAMGKYKISWGTPSLLIYLKGHFLRKKCNGEDEWGKIWEAISPFILTEGGENPPLLWSPLIDCFFLPQCGYCVNTLQVGFILDCKRKFFLCSGNLQWFDGFHCYVLCLWSQYNVESHRSQWLKKTAKIIYSDSPVQHHSLLLALTTSSQFCYRNFQYGRLQNPPKLIVCSNTHWLLVKKKCCTVNRLIVDNMPLNLNGCNFCWFAFFPHPLLLLFSH